MKMLSISLLASAAVVAADPFIAHDYSSPSRYVESVTTTDVPRAYESTQTAAALATPMPTSVAPSHDFHMLPHALKQFILDMSPKSHIEERQNAAPGGGAAAAAAQPTQLSPTTIYDVGQGAMTYIQSFPATPDQFPTPTAGSVGMGNIQGQVGKTRTYNNPAPTPHVDSRVMFAVAGGIGAGLLL